MYSQSTLKKSTLLGIYIIDDFVTFQSSTLSIPRLPEAGKICGGAGKIWELPAQIDRYNITHYLHEMSKINASGRYVLRSGR